LVSGIFILGLEISVVNSARITDRQINICQVSLKSLAPTHREKKGNKYTKRRPFCLIPLVEHRLFKSSK
jgi:hypothetical protein